MPNELTNRGNLRQSNIELLRIIAIIMIIAHHFAVHSGFDFPVNTISINRLWIQFIQIGGKIGVDIFVLISGFFLVSAPSIKTSKIIRLWGQVIFYSVIIFAVFTITGIETFGITDLIYHLAPITFSQWWFASTYFVLYLISPYINRLLRSFDQKQYIGFLLLLTVCWCIIPTLTGASFQSNYLLWFVFLYSLAGYIKLFDFSTNLSGAKLILISAGCIILTFMSAVLVDLLGTTSPVFGENATFFYDMQKLPILLTSLLMFLGFLKLDIKPNKLINIIASVTFGVYLIHDDDYVRAFFWKTIFNNASYSLSFLLIPYSVFVIAIVFICCTIIELLRTYLIERRCMPIIDKIAAFIDNKKEKLVRSISSRCGK